MSLKCMGVFVPSSKGRVPKTVSRRRKGYGSHVRLDPTIPQSPLTLFPYSRYCLRRYIQQLLFLLAEYVSTLTCTDEQKSAVSNLEPSFEHLLRSSSVHESVITSLRVNEITDTDTCCEHVRLGNNSEHVSCRPGCKFVWERSSRKRELSRLVTAWKTAKVMSETKLQTDARRRARGVPATLLPADWTAMMTEVQENARNSYPRRSAASPNVLRKLRGEVGRRSAQTGPSFIDRQRDRGRASRWPKARRQQAPGRSIYKDFDKNTFMDFLDIATILTSTKKLMVVRSSLRNGRTAFPPSWNSRKKQSRYAVKGTRPIEEALWCVLGNTEHRVKHWPQRVPIPNAPESVYKQEVTELKKRTAAMENRRARSRPPRRQQQRRALAGPSFLAVLAPASSSSQPAPPTPKADGKGKIGKGKGNIGTNKSKGAGGSGPMEFNDIMQGPVGARAHFHPRFHSRELCSANELMPAQAAEATSHTITASSLQTSAKST